MKNPKRLGESKMVFARLGVEDDKTLEELCKKYGITKSELIRIVLKSFILDYLDKPLITINFKNEV